MTRIPTINSNDLLNDSREDEIGQLISAMESYDTWTKKCCELRDLAHVKMKQQNHVEFTSHCYNYLLQRVGTSLLYQVPKNKRGYLSPFRGKVIRLVCIGNSENWVRTYIAAPYLGATDCSKD